MKILAKIFDPLGLVTPVTFFGKVFLQELWKEGISWDESLSDNLCVKWKEILHKLKFLSRLKIPRFVGYVEVAKQYSLLVFCDASMKAYSTVIYLRIEEQNVNLMFSKMRLLSRGTNKKRLKKDITLPRLELLAVTIGIRAANFVTSALKITSLKTVLWTDSTCVLHWLKTSKPLSLFVENRVKEILKEIDVTFCYVPSNENPADFPTRGLSHNQLWNYWKQNYGGMDLHS